MSLKMFYNVANFERAPLNFSHVIYFKVYRNRYLFLAQYLDNVGF